MAAVLPVADAPLLSRLPALCRPFAAGVPEAEFAEAVKPSDSVPSVWGAFAASMESWGFSASSPCGAAGLAAMEAAAA